MTVHDLIEKLEAIVEHDATLESAEVVVAVSYDEWSQIDVKSVEVHEGIGRQVMLSE